MRCGWVKKVGLDCLSVLFANRDLVLFLFPWAK